MIDNKRHYPRFQFDEPVEYQRSLNATNGSLAANISVGGIKLVVHEFVALGTVLEMQVHFAHPPRNVLIKGKVMWVKEHSYGERYEIGLEFIKEAQPVQAIGEYINSRRFGSH